MSVDPIVRSAQREQKLYMDVQAAIQQLQREGEIVTQKAVGAIVGLTPEALKAYSSIQPVMAIIANNYEIYLRQRENELLLAVRSAANHLQQQRQPVTQEAIAEIVGMSLRGLYHYPKIGVLLKKLTRQHQEDNYKLKQAQREQEIIVAIRKAAIELFTDKQSITREAILDRINVSNRNISRYKEAREVLKEIITLYNKSQK
jgi:hypothetical protein